MTPLKKELKLDAVTVHRRENCANYSVCLMIAARALMKSFSCLRCEHFEYEDVVISWSREERTYPPRPPRVDTSSNEFNARVKSGMGKNGVPFWNPDRHINKGESKCHER